MCVHDGLAHDGLALPDLMASLMLAVPLWVASAVVSGGALVEPEWDFDMSKQARSGSVCFDASTNHAPAMENNTRWAHWAAPIGAPPPTGFPFFVFFTVVGWTPANRTCGNGWRPYRPPPLPPKCEAALEQQCGAEAAAAANSCGSPPSWSSCNFTACKRCVARVAESPAVERLNCSGGRVNQKHPSLPYAWGGSFCYGAVDGHHKERPVPYGAFATPSQSIQWGFNGDLTINQSLLAVESAAADFPQAGLMWVQRIKQYLLSNGVGVLVLTPYESDSWDWDSTVDWDAGLDKPYLAKLAAAMQAGTFPPPAGRGPGAAGGADVPRLQPPLFDTNRVVVGGYSVGAQMASWMVQVHATKTFTRSVNVSAAVMMSGGSHLCYRNNPRSSTGSRRQPPDPSLPALAQCANCNSSMKCGTQELRVPEPGGKSRMVAQPTQNCSDTYIDPARPPCCQYCCPKGYTESWYADHPEDYATHPPTFLAQMTTGDKNADLCAAKNYHETMLAHGAKSVLSLVLPQDERCYCLGTPGLLPKGAVAAGDTWSSACPQVADEPPNRQNYSDGKFKCMPHMMAHSGMVRPLVQFVLDAVGHESAATVVSPDDVYRFVTL